MEIGRITGATRVLGKSQGYYGLPIRDEAKALGDLPHMLETTGFNPVDGTYPTMQTVWFPSPDELARLNAGAGIHVELVGSGHPPIMVMIGQPPAPEPVQMWQECPTCKGYGFYSDGPDNFDCSNCGGKGVVLE